MYSDIIVRSMFNMLMSVGIRKIERKIIKVKKANFAHDNFDYEVVLLMATTYIRNDSSTLILSRRQMSNLQIIAEGIGDIAIRMKDDNKAPVKKVMYVLGMKGNDGRIRQVYQIVY
ncbi:hypothetical protein MTR_8g072870 [Medicago truncatula]|uniref:Uncharacterized protein n=1 Tax=Medicago truncatula TaxID=3880 RepID=G7L8M0_MEDTR|nr:hypothetical protein MTR_8g072870 [Medicago truncatula]